MPRTARFGGGTVPRPASASGDAGFYRKTGLGRLLCNAHDAQFPRSRRSVRIGSPAALRSVSIRSRMQPDLSPNARLQSNRRNNDGSSEESVMTNISITQTTLRLFAGCSLALLVATGGGVAFAHGGGGHNGSDHANNGGDHISRGSHGPCVDCDGGKNIDSNYWRHHHHHHNTASGPGGLGPVHGSGSSHNPIIYHPPVKPPITGVGPAKLPKNPNPTFCQLQTAGVQVRNHRSTSGPYRGGAHCRGL
jgi:hypothetical protein